jgi:lysozyme family protein
MNLTFQALQPDYAHRLSVMKLLKMPQAEAVAKNLLVNRQKFVDVQNECGVPALWIMAVFEREDPSFLTYLGNGDPLDRVTVDVPAGRGPFASWEAGCIDALNYDKITSVTTWTWEQACYQWEKWNGFGYREYHKIASPYLWSGTDQYSKGKYIADGRWSSNTIDQQLGTVIIAQAIAALDTELGNAYIRA